MIQEIVDTLASLQEQTQGEVLFGNYPSTRYHRLLGFKRVEDNVYFVAWINQSLRRNKSLMSNDLSLKAEGIIERGEQAISVYTNRYGGNTYNFYRPKQWFPNGKFLSRFVQFQPTDDADDTSIAFRGRMHSKELAQEIKEIYSHQSNGLRGRFIKRIPHRFRERRFYNTWIGSEKLYVDTDLVVLSNILIFNATYDLGILEEDKASLLFIRDTVRSGEYLSKKWSLAAWYPFDAVILYSLADMLSLAYYPDMDETRNKIHDDLLAIVPNRYDLMSKLLVDIALMKLGSAPRFDLDITELEPCIRETSRFSFGVIPLLHPWNGLLAQSISRFSIFRMYYDCEAQRVAILLEYTLMRAQQDRKSV